MSVSCKGYNDSEYLTVVTSKWCKQLVGQNITYYDGDTKPKWENDIGLFQSLFRFLLGADKQRGRVCITV